MKNSPAYVENEVQVVKEIESEKENKEKNVEEDITVIKNYRNNLLNSVHVNAADKNLVLPTRLSTIQSGKELLQ